MLEVGWVALVGAGVCVEVVIIVVVVLLLLLDGLVGYGRVGGGAAAVLAVRGFGAETAACVAWVLVGCGGGCSSWDEVWWWWMIEWWMRWMSMNQYGLLVGGR